MKLRKLFAGAAAAATLLGGMAFGATTANAAEANISSTTITVNATDANQFYTKPVDTADLQANLRMFKYVPSGLPAGAPMVVALHGCAQSASSYDDETGWQLLADRYRFSLLLPQQQSANNSSSCFKIVIL